MVHWYINIKISLLGGKIMKNKNFALLLAGQGISQVGDKFHMIALSIWVLQTTGSSAKMGMVLAASLVPSLLIGLFSGVVVDRYSRKAIIVGTDMCRGILLSFFAALFYMEAMNFPLVLAMQVLLSVNAAFFDPAIPAVIPTIVPEEKLAAANSKHQLINSFSMIFGAVAGGLAVSHLGFFFIFVINALSFLISAAFECFIDIPRGLQQREGIESRPSSRGFLSELESGYRYIFANRQMVILLLMVGIIHFFVGSIEVIMPVMAEMLGNDGAKNLGVFQGAFGAGGVIMAFCISRFNISSHERVTLFCSVFAVGVLYVVAGLMTSVRLGTVFLFAAAVFGIGSAIMTAAISFRTLLQKLARDRYAGRVFAVAGSLGNAAVPAAMIFYGVLLENYNSRDLLLISGLVLMGISLGSHMLYNPDIRDKEKNDGGKKQALAEKGTAD